MTAAGIVWVVVTPYCTGLLVAWSQVVNRIVTRHVRVSTAVGWAGLATLFVGVFALGGHTGMVMAAVSAPLAGLAVWKLTPGDEGGPDPPPPDDLPPAPDASVHPSHHRRHHARRGPVRPLRARTYVRDPARRP